MIRCQRYINNAKIMVLLKEKMVTSFSIFLFKVGSNIVQSNTQLHLGMSVIRIVVISDVQRKEVVLLYWSVFVTDN